MSGYSDGTICPNCGKEAQLYTDWKPFDYSSITCLYCGLSIYPKIEYMDLETLNSEREDAEMNPLKRLPKQNRNIW